MCNMHKPFEQIIEKAGYKTWPNLIKNLRLSCENDWLTAAEAPAHVIAAWIGHDIAVQNSNYAIVSDGHFEQFNSRFEQPKKKATEKATDDAQNAAKRHELTNQRDFKKPAKTLATSVFAGQTTLLECSGEDSNRFGRRLQIPQGK